MRLLLLCLLLAGSATAQRTVPERTDFLETSRHADVLAFIADVASSERLFATTMGYSNEGRAIPLVIVGADDPSPAGVRASGKTRVYLQGNIHAGEVCGKEALQMMLRELADGEGTAWTDSLILLIAPIYNADGNERIHLRNRGRQHGPLAGMGQRPNAQDLDLNRDHTKLESPESRALVALYDAYDPHVVVDLHTTNGTYHAYHLTYAPPLHPNTPASIDRMLRDDWLPWITDRVEDTYGWHFYHYGNMPWPGVDAPDGWYTFDARPRFSSNYAGLRNRFGILSEAYSYLTFEERIQATKVFVEQILDYASINASAIRAVTENADRHAIVGDSLAVRADYLATPDSVEILMGDVVEETNPYSGELILRRLDVVNPTPLKEYIAFQPSDWERVPSRYFLPAEATQALALLDAHGIKTQALNAPMTVDVEVFDITGSTLAQREFQGHRQRSIEGQYRTDAVELPAGTVQIEIDQPLGRLAFFLLEPRSDDGFTNWNVFDDLLDGATQYPVVRSVD
ncbi:MAG: M14 family metallopeptidase [Bacteroidota bacterium]